MLSVEIGISILFFFSSRRRHTRLQGDWSSDVCSSDLEEFVRSDERLPADPRRGEIDQALVRHVDTLKGDRKSTRLNSSHLVISYAVFCLKKKKTETTARASYDHMHRHAARTHVS